MAVFDRSTWFASGTPSPGVSARTTCSVAVDDRPSWTCMENEARNLAAWMCWHVRGQMVTAARIVSVEE